MKKSKVIWLTLILLFLVLIVCYLYPEKQLREGQKADRIVVNKSEHELLLYDKEELVARYKVSLSKKGLAEKTKEGDNLTPEGIFKAKKIYSQKFRKAISVGKWGDCCAVLIHGLEPRYSWVRKFQRWMDWTEGCIALTNDEMNEIYEAIIPGSMIEINP
jgi:murein L,D-transpeptidase YafK